MNGILLIDKPRDWTSHDEVAKLRGLLREKRIGHAGTLDPMATGLLVVFVGRATRAASYAEAEEKRYTAGLRLGLETDTQDVTGTVLRRWDGPLPGRADVEAALPAFRGEIRQIPPMYSAIKVAGRKLYEIARKGGEVERAPRDITIHSLELTGGAGADWTLELCCSKGTYVRTLCHDLGRALGCGGAMSALRRTGAGAYSVEEAVTLDEIAAAAASGEAEGLLLPVDRLFARYPAVSLSPRQVVPAKNGAAVSQEAPAGLCRVYAPDGEFLLLGRSEDGKIYTVKSFFSI